MIVRTVSQDNLSMWDEYVIAHHESVSYQLSGWGQACGDSYKHPTFYLQAEDKGRVVGVLPLVYIKPPFISGELVSLPFCDTGWAICDSTEVYGVLIDEAISLGQRLKVRHVEFRCFDPCQVLNKRPDVYKLPSNKVTMILSMSGSSDELLSGFKSKLRSQVKKASKNGLEFKWGGAEKLEEYFPIYAINMKSLGSPVHSLGWFESLSKAYGDKLKVGVVYHEDVPIGAGIIICHGNTVAIPWASTLRKYNHLSTNMMLYWNLLKFASDSGFSYFDFGRSTPGEGTYKFKAQWGAEPTPLYWCRIDISGKSDTSTSGSSVNGGIAVRLWKKLPISVANYLGPKIRKYVSL